MATLYFNAAVDNDWNTLGNWWEDDQFTIAASALPTSSDSVIVNASLTSNSGSEPTVVNFTMSGSYVYLDIPITVSGTATFNNDSYNSGTVTGTIIYNGLTGYVGGESIYYVKGQPSSLDSNGDGNWNGTDYLAGIPAATLYYNAASDTDWNNLNNWWSNSGVSVQATFLPRSIDSVIFISGSQCLSNGGSQPTIKNLTLN